MQKVIIITKEYVDNVEKKIEYHRNLPIELINQSIFLTNCFSEDWAYNNTIEIPYSIHLFDDFINNNKSNNTLANLLLMANYFQLDNIQEELIKNITNLNSIYELYENFNILYFNFNIQFQDLIINILEKLNNYINEEFAFRKKENYVINNKIAMLLDMPFEVILEYTNTNIININFIAEWYEHNFEKLNIIQKNNLIYNLDNNNYKLNSNIDIDAIMQSTLYSECHNLAHKILESQLNILNSFNRIENKYNNFSVNITIPGLVQNARAKIVDVLNTEEQVFCVNIKY